ncbi:MAG TPA: YciI family protein [Methylomirabilota bacterium]|nr:YciI family protein [Methylomirabilota bacterium]
MSTEKSDYMLLFRGTDWGNELSPEQIQKVATDWMAWFERLRKQGKVTSGHPLMNEGKVVSGKKGRMVVDGPFAESKEAIGGYFYLRVDSMEEAIAIAQECPGLEFGAEVEVRPVADQCGIMARAKLSDAELARFAHPIGA